MWTDVVLLLALATAFSCLRCYIDVRSRAQVQPRACQGEAFILYVLVSAVGNALTTRLAASLLSKQLSTTLQPMLPLFAAFAGVFAFEGVVSRTNITVFGKGALAIEDWIAKARDNAVAQANVRQVQLSRQEQLTVATALQALPDAELNVYIAQHLGPEAMPQLEAAAAQASADPALYKAMMLASGKPEAAAVILRDVQRRQHS